MKKVKTEAAKAEAELNQLLGEENRIHKSHVLQYRKIEPLQIEGIADDILLLLFEPNYVRPGFKVESDIAEIPSIFCKLTGDVDNFLADFRLWQKNNLSPICINRGYKGIAKPPRKHVFNKRPKWFSSEKGINVEMALTSDLGPLNLLSPAYRRNYLEAVNNVLALFKQTTFSFTKLTEREILETLLFNSNKIIKMFHNYDYQKHAPKFVIDESGKTIISQFAFVRMLLMQNLGFDVILLSKDGFASIENFVSSEDCPIYHLTESEQKYSVTHRRSVEMKKKTLKLALILGGIALVFMILRIL